MTNSSLQQWIDRLSDKTSTKRRSAAKKLRKLKDKEAGPALVDALTRELKDKRTWETQYHMIMALGESSYVDSLSFLSQLSKQEFEASMVLTALGDSITRLELQNNNSNSNKSLHYWIESDQVHLVNGGIRALAMERVIPDQELIIKILQYVELPKNQHLDFWVAAACPLWPKEQTEQFLIRCMESSKLEDTKKAALAALNGKYKRYSIL